MSASGAITHQDSMGNKGRTAAGDVQVMSAGTGVRHAEYNLEDEATTLFQIWVLTDRPGAEPGWGATKFPKDDRSGRFVTLASGFDEDADALKINAAARVLGATLKAGETAELSLDPARHVYLVAAAGRRRGERRPRRAPRRRRHHRRGEGRRSRRSTTPRSCWSTRAEGDSHFSPRRCRSCTAVRKSAVPISYSSIRSRTTRRGSSRST